MPSKLKHEVWTQSTLTELNLRLALEVKSEKATESYGEKEDPCEAEVDGFGHPPLDLTTVTFALQDSLDRLTAWRVAGTAANCFPSFSHLLHNPCRALNC